ncbi:hypothetical protein ACFWP5_08930 [Streptomyces sp. NPDC058469]|uniref:hypothetical protein n=1 Tax=Streptomyces sp. NPDC058469 TaxID=3346514 RepID=UPI00364EA6DD
MGRIGNSTKRIPNSGGVFIKFNDGDKFRFRLLEEPWVRITQYGNDDPSHSYLFPVWDYAAEKVRILSQSIAGAKAIDDMNDEWGGEEYPSKFDLTVSAVGSGQNGRKYTRTSSPHQGTMPPSNQLEMIDMAKVADGAIPLVDFEAGKDPEVRTLDNAEEPKAPKSDDVLPTEADLKNINLDDIPF